jgi:DNA invertase Pin-like site-specific DNA recombinase
MSKGKRIGYIRVSTADQNPDRQLESIQLDKKFIEYASGSSMKRPVLLSMIDYVREDDLVLVHSMDRMARTLKDLRKIIDELVEKGVGVQFIKENLTFTGENSPMANLLLSVMGAVAEFEHSIIRERQAEGIALAKKAGKYRGRKKSLNKADIERLKEFIGKKKSKSQIARDFGISLPTFYKYSRIAEQQQTA